MVSHCRVCASRPLSRASLFVCVSPEGVLVQYRAPSRRRKSRGAGPGVGGGLWGDGAGSVGVGGDQRFAEYEDGDEDEDEDEAASTSLESDGFLPPLARAATPHLAPREPHTRTPSPSESGHRAYPRPRRSWSRRASRSLELALAPAHAAFFAAPGVASGGARGGVASSPSVDSLAVGTIVWDEWASGPAGDPRNWQRHRDHAPDGVADDLSSSGRAARHTALKQAAVQAKRQAAHAAKAAKAAQRDADREAATRKRLATEDAIIAALSVRLHRVVFLISF